MGAGKPSRRSPRSNAYQALAEQYRNVRAPQPGLTRPGFPGAIARTGPGLGYASARTGPGLGYATASPQRGLGFSYPSLNFGRTFSQLADTRPVGYPGYPGLTLGRPFNQLAEPPKKAAPKPTKKAAANPPKESVGSGTRIPLAPAPEQAEEKPFFASDVRFGDYGIYGRQDKYAGDYSIGIEGDRDNPYGLFDSIGKAEDYIKKLRAQKDKDPSSYTVLDYNKKGEYVGYKPDSSAKKTTVVKSPLDSYKEKLDDMKEEKAARSPEPAPVNDTFNVRDDLKDEPAPVNDTFNVRDDLKDEPAPVNDTFNVRADPAPRKAEAKQPIRRSASAQREQLLAMARKNRERYLRGRAPSSRYPRSTVLGRGPQDSRQRDAYSILLGRMRGLRG